MGSAVKMWFNLYLNGTFTSGEFVQKNLNLYFTQLKNNILDGIADVLPLALSVGGAILVVNLGWRMFRNFTRG